MTVPFSRKAARSLMRLARRASVITELHRLRDAGETATLTDIGRAAGYGRWLSVDVYREIRTIVAEEGAAEVIR